MKAERGHDPSYIEHPQCPEMSPYGEYPYGCNRVNCKHRIGHLGDHESHFAGISWPNEKDQPTTKGT